MASIKNRLDETFELMDKKIGKLSFPRKLYVLADIVNSKRVYKANKIDYFQYGFYNLKKSAREQFVTIGKLSEFHHTSNDKEKSKIFSEKAQFVKVFKDFIGRDVLDMNTASFEEFSAFTQKHDKMFIKPEDGTYGKGVEILDCSPENARELYEKLKGKNILAEELVKQHPALAAFNSSSLNSVRIVTFLRKNGEAVVMPGSVIRVGRKGRIADNFHHMGMGAQIDNETGIICTTGIDKAGNRYITHPDSNISLLGFKVPHWDKVKETVLAAAKVVPEVRYVGWDVAITDDDRVIIIEGNDRADPDLGQMSDRTGKWPEFKKYLDELRNN